MDDFLFAFNQQLKEKEVKGVDLVVEPQIYVQKEAKNLNLIVNRSPLIELNIESENSSPENSSSVEDSVIEEETQSTEVAVALTSTANRSETSKIDAVEGLTSPTEVELDITSKGEFLSFLSLCTMKEAEAKKERMKRIKTRTKYLAIAAPSTFGRRAAAKRDAKSKQATTKKITKKYEPNGRNANKKIAAPAEANAKPKNL